MHLTIAAFHARFTSPEQDRLMTALRKLRRLADVHQIFDPTGAPVWDKTFGTSREAPSPSHG
ncbi:MAG TPA: hypothetical protein VF121_05555 [Thermoanaerobaculia bacterium]|nr:hypothetical protein [Thermoanaerobaculia bacterium]